MNKGFKFAPIKVGEPEQAIRFQADGEEPVNHPIPDMVLPEDPTERFWALHAELKRAGLIEHIETIYNQ